MRSAECEAAEPVCGMSGLIVRASVQHPMLQSGQRSTRIGDQLWVDIAEHNPFAVGPLGNNGRPMGRSASCDHTSSGHFHAVPPCAGASTYARFSIARARSRTSQ